MKLCKLLEAMQPHDKVTKIEGKMDTLYKWTTPEYTFTTGHDIVVKSATQFDGKFFLASKVDKDGNRGAAKFPLDGPIGNQILSYLEQEGYDTEQLTGLATPFNSDDQY